MTTMEPIVFILRSGKDHNQYGDPYQFTATVVKIGKTAHVYAGVGTIHSRSQVRDLLIQHGFEDVAWERIENGNVTELRYSL